MRLVRVRGGIRVGAAVRVRVGVRVRFRFRVRVGVRVRVSVRRQRCASRQSTTYYSTDYRLLTTYVAAAAERDGVVALEDDAAPLEGDIGRYREI